MMYPYTLLKPLPLLVIATWLYWSRRDITFKKIMVLALPGLLFFQELWLTWQPSSIYSSWYFLILEFGVVSAPIIYLASKWGYHKKELGLTRNNGRQSIRMGLIAAGITLIANSLLLPSFDPPKISIVYDSFPLLLSAFNEELLFRGVLFHLFWRKSRNVGLAFCLSMLSFLLWHPLEFAKVLPTLIQGALMCKILHKSGNLYGAWLAHGLNRLFLPFVASVI